MAEKKDLINNDDELRRRAQEQALKNGLAQENIDALSQEDTRHLLHDLRVHQIELEMQNEELRRAQVELEDSRSRYFDLYDLAPVGYCTLNDKGLILEANLTSAAMLGVVRSALIKQPLSSFIHNEDQEIYYLHRKLLFETGSPQVCELRMLRHDGTTFWARLEAAAAKDTDGTPMCRAIMSDITKHRHAEDRIKNLLAEKELLLKEVHHRVKNNMNTIFALIALQMNKINEPSALTALNDTASRVRSMMVLYDKINRTGSYNELSIKQYLSTLADDIIGSSPSGMIIKIEKNIDDFILEAVKVSPLGLIVSELLTNIMKYAFKGRNDGIITISASRKDNHATIVVQDNGIGIPESINFENTTGFGLQLVEMLTKQLDGTIRIERNNGTRIILEFPV
jgi:PAS domain S-box-containing protein